MAPALLRTSAHRGNTFRRCVSAARSGGEGLVSLWRSPLPRFSHSAAPGGRQIPECPEEKLDVLLEEIRAKRAISLSNDMVLGILLSSMFARKEWYTKQLWRSGMTGFVLVSGGSIGYYIAQHKNRNGAREGN